MKRHRRPLLLVASFAAVALGACSKNPATAPGIDNEILVQSAGPLGVAPAGLPYAWAVNTIDSVVFATVKLSTGVAVGFDSTVLTATSYRVTDPQGATVAGQVRFMPSNAYIFYTQGFPNSAYDFEIFKPPMNNTLGKVYFVPAQPLHGHTEYTCRLTTGIRMEKGSLRRDVFTFSFVTGDSVAPPR